jgi:hypothetical protein
MDLIKCKIENENVVMSKLELNKWFIENSGTDGVVEKTIVIYDTVNNIKNGEFVMSNGDLNRLGMKVDPSGWVLDNYKANPVLLWNHDDRIPAIGNMNNVRIDGKSLVGKPVFAEKEVDEFAWSIGQKVESGILTSGSVGFMTTRVEVEEKDNKLPVVISREQELFEFSIVNLPALVSAVKHNLTDTREDDYMEQLFVDREKPEETQETIGTSLFDKKESTLSIFKKDEE